MKKYFALLISLLLLSSSMFNVSADDGLEFSAVGRLEAEKYPGSRGVGLGQSSLYTFLDWEFEENWSFTMSNHLLYSDPDVLYTDIFKSAGYDFVDWAYVTYKVGSFSFELGKDMISLGLFEYEDNDVDSYWQLKSKLWNETNMYQWGAKAKYVLDENNIFTFNVSNSPLEYGKYFEHGLFAFGLEWDGEIENFKTKWSLNRFGKEDPSTHERSADWFLLLGNSYSLGSVEFSGDVYIRNLHSFIPAVEAKTGIDDILDISARVGLYGGNGFFAGASVEAWPIRDFRSLSFFLCSSFQGYYDQGYAGCLGIKYTFSR